MFAADRFSGEPKPGCDVQVLANQQPVGNGQTGDDGVVSMSLPSLKAEDIVGVARCGEEVAATDPGGWFASESARAAARLHLHRQADLPAGAHRAHEGGAALARARRAAAVRSTERRDQRDAMPTTRSCSGSRSTPTRSARSRRRSPCRTTAALGFYSVRVAVGDQQASGGFEVQEYRRPEFEVIVTPTSRFVVQGSEAVASVQARYYFGQPVANARVRYVVNQQAYYSPLRWTDDVGRGGRRPVLVRRRPEDRGRASARRAGTRRDPRAAGRGRERPRLQRAHRSAGDRREQPRGQRQHGRARDLRTVSARRRRSAATSSGRRRRVTVSLRARGLHGHSARRRADSRRARADPLSARAATPNPTPRRSRSASATTTAADGSAHGDGDAAGRRRHVSRARHDHGGRSRDQSRHLDLRRRQRRRASRPTRIAISS